MRIQVIFSNPQPVNSVRSEEKDHLEQVEQFLLQVTEQLSVLGSRLTTSQSARCCFNCGQPGHLAKNCRAQRMIRCFSCGRTGHVARDCRNQGNGQGGAQIPRESGTWWVLTQIHMQPHTNAHTHIVPTLIHNKYTNRVVHTTTVGP